MPKLYRKQLDYLTVKGFRSIEDIEKLELGWVNVLVGANGAGKSNFVAVFDLLRALRQGRLASYTETRGGADAILHRGSKVTPQLELELSFQDETNGYHVCLATTGRDSFTVQDEWCWYWEKEQFPNPKNKPLKSVEGEAGISGQHVKIAGYVQDHLDAWRVYHFHDTSDTAPMKRACSVDDNRLLQADGSNLAAYLHVLREEEPDRYQMIRKTIQSVAPFFRDFELKPLRRNSQKIKLEWRQKNSDQYLDASALSDGTLRFMCLATLLLGPAADRPSVVLLDEPELGLHPYALTMLANMIASVAKQTQIIVATQSPLLLDHFAPEDVIVAELAGGATTMRRLESRELEEWLGEYSLGQLWEKNQFGGRPTRA